MGSVSPRRHAGRACVQLAGGACPLRAAVSGSGGDNGRQGLRAQGMKCPAGSPTPSLQPEHTAPSKRRRALKAVPSHCRGPGPAPGASWSTSPPQRGWERGEDRQIQGRGMRGWPGKSSQKENLELRRAGWAALLLGFWRKEQPEKVQRGGTSGQGRLRRPAGQKHIPSSWPLDPAPNKPSKQTRAD